jgi:hypothetical protein
MTMPDPIQPGQPRREIKNYSGNFLNSPDLAPGDFHLFGLLKNHLCGNRFTDEGKVEMEVQWLRQVLVEDMSRNKCFFHVQISHVLHFISVCDLLTDFPLHN